MTPQELKQNIISELPFDTIPEFVKQNVADRIIDHFCDYLEANKTGVVMSVVIVPEIIEKLKSLK